MASRLPLGPIFLDVPDDWADVTDDLADDDPPLTLERQSDDACGGLQFSFAIYKSGPVADPSPETLADMVRDFGKTHGLVAQGVEHVESAPLRLAAETFRDDDWLIRAWYISDGLNIAKVTYTVQAAESFASELEACEQMIRTISFSQ